MVRFIAFVTLTICTPLWASCPEKPQSNFDTSESGVVRDSKTGLTWMRCSLGSEWKDNTCVGVSKRFEWKRAQQAVESINSEDGYASHTDWRLPTTAELRSLINSNCFDPAIDSHTFPAIIPTGFWTSDVSQEFPEAANLIHFYHGADYVTSKTKTWYVRPVRATK